MRIAHHRSKASQADETTLIRNVLAGEKGDFQLLVELHQDRVFAMIMRQVGDETLCKDLAQETFIRAYQHLHTFRCESRFSTWITRIALNVTASYFSSKQFRDRQRARTLEESQIDLSPVEEASNEIYTPGQLEELRIAIGTLKPKFREVLILCCLESRRYQDVADLLHIPVGTVCSRMNTALSQLRKAIGGGRR